MAQGASTGPLRVGLLGSGFIARFHLQAFVGVRNVQVAGVFSPNPHHRDEVASLANRLDLGPCATYASVEELKEQVGASSS